MLAPMYGHGPAIPHRYGEQPPTDSTSNACSQCLWDPDALLPHSYSRSRSNWPTHRASPDSAIPDTPLILHGGQCAPGSALNYKRLGAWLLVNCQRLILIHS